MSKTTIFIDESGTLPDPHGPTIVLAAVCTKAPFALDASIKKLRNKRIHKEKPFELKFYTAGDKTKLAFFGQLTALKLDIFALIVDKAGRKIPDTPQNFAVLCWLLLESLFPLYPRSVTVIFDRHFHKDRDTEEFNKILLAHVRQQPESMKHVDSKRNYLVTVADMVAGAILAKESGKDQRFYEMIKPLIISETKLNWPEAKRRLVNKKLA